MAPSISQIPPTRRVRQTIITIIDCRSATHAWRRVALAASPSRRTTESPRAVPSPTGSFTFSRSWHTEDHRERKCTPLQHKQKYIQKSNKKLQLRKQHTRTPTHTRTPNPRIFGAQGAGCVYNTHAHKTPAERKQQEEVAQPKSGRRPPPQYHTFETEGRAEKSQGMYVSHLCTLSPRIGWNHSRDLRGDGGGTHIRRPIERVIRNRGRRRRVRSFTL